MSWGVWLNERFIIAPIYLNDTRFSKTQEYVSKCFSLSDGPEILKFITCDIDTYNTSRSGQVDKCIRELLQSPQQSTGKVQFTNQVCDYEARKA